MAKKIVFLSRYQGKVERGVESAVYELSKRLKKYFDVSVFSGTKADSVKEILRGKFDIVIPTNGRLQALKVSLGRFFGKYKVIIVGHSGVGRDDLWNLLLCRPDVFIALTEFQKKWAEKLSLGSKVIKIPNGVDLEKFKKDGSSANINLDKPIILSVGSLNWYKYHKRTIRAVSHMLRGSLIIIGEGPDKEELKEYGIKLLGEKRFRVVLVPYKEIPDYYRSANVFTLPSWDRESFGIVYLEALATNLPVVAPVDSVRKEIIGAGGVLTNVEDPQRFALSLENALSTDWGNKPRKQAEKFSWDIVSKQYVELFNSLI